MSPPCNCIGASSHCHSRRAASASPTPWTVGVPSTIVMVKIRHSVPKDRNRLTGPHAAPAAARPRASPPALAQPLRYPPSSAAHDDPLMLVGPPCAGASAHNLRRPATSRNPHLPDHPHLALPPPRPTRARRRHAHARSVTSVVTMRSASWESVTFCDCGLEPAGPRSRVGTRPSVSSWGTGRTRSQRRTLLRPPQISLHQIVVRVRSEMHTVLQRGEAAQKDVVELAAPVSGRLARTGR